MAQIKRIRRLQGAGVLANKAARDIQPDFLRYNLIYGFNGSGKSTLSRLFASLEAATVDPELPEGCSFEFELDDGKTLSAPDNLKGLEETVCVFNTDFVEKNFKWAQGTAKAIFYIGKEQTDAFGRLKEAEKALPAKRTETHAAAQSAEDKRATLATFKRTHARTVAGKLHLGSRKYEANNLQADYEKLPYDATSRVSDARLEDLEEIARRSQALPHIETMAVRPLTLIEIAADARECASATVGMTMLRELESHPAMVPWVKSGFEYHSERSLKDCLLCGQQLTPDRRTKLAGAFNDALNRFITQIGAAKQNAFNFKRAYDAELNAAKGAEFVPELKAEAKAAIEALRGFSAQFDTTINEALRVYDARQRTPTVTLECRIGSADAMNDFGLALVGHIEAVNAVVDRHNEAVRDFDQLQQSTRDAIKKHFLAVGHDEFTAATKAVKDAETGLEMINGELETLEGQIESLKRQVRRHGPAAEVINNLVHAYLGHRELAIHIADSGYELHRHGKRVKGAPSEGEKTAIALCYFLSTLGADDRKLKDLIVLVDDPVSSLDTRAMNYACALIRSRLRGAAQVFVLTHNQHCMNEFKKDWKKAAEEKQQPDDKDPTATLLFLDAKIPTESAPRESRLATMSKLLREHDSEYHFLCQKLLEFEAAGDTHFQYAFLMPNIMRKVMEIFLAFKVPGTHGPKDKLAELCRIHTSLDPVRMAALERLAQVESHADNLDDLVSHSSITIEEARDANAALLALMMTADAAHAEAIRRQCRPA